MLETKHHWLPVFIAVYLPISFIITYSIAVANDHVEPGFPYISDTGTRSPESCVFGQLLNIGALIAGIIVYVRYRHIHTHFISIPGRNGMIKLNEAAFIIGMLTNLGVSLVGNFQETNVLAVHLIGAFLAFGIGFVYLVLQTIISYNTVNDVAVPGTSLNIRRLRLFLCVADIVLLIILTVFSQMANRKWLKNHEGKTRQKWAASDPGHTEHVIATSSEWVVAFVTVAYFASFYTEFKHFRMKPPEVHYYPEGQKDSNENPVQGTAIAVISGQ